MNKSNCIVIGLLFILVIFNTETVKGEIGNITIEQAATPTAYHFNNFGSSSTINWTVIKYDSVSYNKINDFKIKTYGGYVLTFAHDFESTPFSCMSGCSGTGGIAYYDKNATNASNDQKPCILIIAGTMATHRQQSSPE